jgi:SAM-dependent methyltransferase
MKVRSVERPRFSATGKTRWKHPNEAVHNRIAYRVMENMLTYAADGYARGRLVDIGCGSKPWKGLFAEHVDEHIGVDLVPSERDPTAVDIIAGAYEIPLPDGHADTVLITSVLEHLEEPQRAIDETYRLLRPGGHLLVSAPFFWHLHEEPRDFYRFSPYALRNLLEQAGYEILELHPLAGAWTTLSIELSYALRRYRRGLARPLVDGVTMFAQWVAGRWDRVDFQPGFSWSHLAIARKPEEDVVATRESRAGGDVHSHLVLRDAP